MTTEVCGVESHLPSQARVTCALAKGHEGAHAASTGSSGAMWGQSEIEMAKDQFVDPAASEDAQHTIAQIYVRHLPTEAFYKMLEATYRVAFGKGQYHERHSRGVEDRLLVTDLCDMNAFHGEGRLGQVLRRAIDFIEGQNCFPSGGEHGNEEADGNASEDATQQQTDGRVGRDLRRAGSDEPRRAGSDRDTPAELDSRERARAVASAWRTRFDALSAERDAWRRRAQAADKLLDAAVPDADWRIVERARDVLKDVPHTRVRSYDMGVQAEAMRRVVEVSRVIAKHLDGDASEYGVAHVNEDHAKLWAALSDLDAQMAKTEVEEKP